MHFSSWMYTSDGIILNSSSKVYVDSYTGKLPDFNFYRNNNKFYKLEKSVLIL